MENNKWLNLQLFAGEGTGDGGGEAATTGDNSADAGHQRLLELGVPESKIRKSRAYKLNATTPKAVEAGQAKGQEQQAPQVAAAQNPTEANKTDATPARKSFKELLEDPEYNREMQSIVQSRVRGARAAEETLGKLAPALELLARQHNLDPSNIDYDALAKAISDDESFYEDRALQMGVSLETAKKIDQEERDTARKQRQEEQTLQQQKVDARFNQIFQQSEEMKKVFPNFDLRKEMENPAFARLMAPDMPFTVEQAYYAVHHKELQTAGMQVAAQKTAQKISNDIASGSRRPSENGITGQAPSVTTFDYSKASPEQRKAFKQFIRSEAAQGRKVYPGR